MDHFEKANPSNQNPHRNNDLESPETRESFRQNLYFAEKILDIDGMLPAPSDDHDIRKITRGKVEAMLYAHQLEIEDYIIPEHRPGPAGINPWIWENNVLPEIHSLFLRDYLARSLQCVPSTFYVRYCAVKNLIRHVARIYQILESQVSDEHLVNPEIYDRLVNSPVKPPVSRLLIQYLKRLQGDSSITPSSRVSMELHPKIKQYQLNMQQQGFSGEYIRHCIAHVHELFSWISSNIREFTAVQPQNLPILRIKNEHLMAYRSHKLKQVKSAVCTPVTFCHGISAIRSFYYFLQKEHGYNPPLQRFRAIKAPRYKPRDIPTEVQIHQFFHVVEMYAEDPVLEQIGYRLMLELGLRLSEVAKVTWGDINLGTRTIRIHSKGKKSHTLPLAGRLYHCLQLARNQQPDQSLVLGETTNSIADNLYRSYKWYAMIAGWSFPGGVHFFRHVFITNLTRRKILPQTLKELARVVNLDTVGLYMHLGQHNQYLSNQINMLNYNL